MVTATALSGAGQSICRVETLALVRCVARERRVEVERKTAFAVALQPVVEVEPGADFRDRVANRLLVGGEVEVHAALLVGDPGRRAFTPMNPPTSFWRTPESIF